MRVPLGEKNVLVTSPMVTAPPSVKLLAEVELSVHFEVPLLRKPVLLLAVWNAPFTVNGPVAVAVLVVKPPEPLDSVTEPIVTVPVDALLNAPEPVSWVNE